MVDTRWLQPIMVTVSQLVSYIISCILHCFYPSRQQTEKTTIWIVTHLLRRITVLGYKMRDCILIYLGNGFHYCSTNKNVPNTFGKHSEHYVHKSTETVCLRSVFVLHFFKINATLLAILLCNLMPLILRQVSKLFLKPLYMVRTQQNSIFVHLTDEGAGQHCRKVQASPETLCRNCRCEEGSHQSPRAQMQLRHSLTNAYCAVFLLSIRVVSQNRVKYEITHICPLFLITTCRSFCMRDCRLCQ